MWSSSIRPSMSTTAPRCWRWISLNRCSARARWCGGGCGVSRASAPPRTSGAQRAAAPACPPEARLRLARFAGRQLLHVDAEAWRPGALDAELRDHVVRVLARALPAAAMGLFLAVLGVVAWREYQHLSLTRDGAAAEAARALDVQVLKLPARRIPQVERLALVLASRTAVHDVLVTHEFVAVDPGEAVHVGDVPAREGTFPAVSDQERESLVGGGGGCGGRRIRAGQQRACSQQQDRKRSHRGTLAFFAQGLIADGRIGNHGRTAAAVARARAARASRRVESSVGNGELASFIRSGISVHPSTTASQPASF